MQGVNSADVCIPCRSDYFTEPAGFFAPQLDDDVLFTETTNATWRFRKHSRATAELI